jgi:hypothetical protein
MTLGYNQPLYILPFDHRGSFQTGMFGWKGALSPEQTAQIAAAKLDHTILSGGYPPATALLILGNEGAGVVDDPGTSSLPVGARVMFPGPYGVLEDGISSEWLAVRGDDDVGDRRHGRCARRWALAGRRSSERLERRDLARGDRGGAPQLPPGAHRLAAVTAPRTSGIRPL